MREPDCERAWFDCWGLKLILERFMADDGMGMAEMLLLVGASVCMVSAWLAVSSSAMRWKDGRDRNSPGGGPRRGLARGPW